MAGEGLGVESLKPLNGNSRSGQHLNLAIISLDEHSRAQIRALASSTPSVRLRAEFPQYVSEDRELRFSEPPDICLIDFDRDPDEATRVVQRIQRLFPGATVLAVSWEIDPHSIVRAMRCGCSDYFLKPLDPQIVLKALYRLTQESDKGHHARSQVLSFIGAKGGCGTTLLAVYLSEFLVKLHRRSALLIDHHPRCGDLALYLALDKHRYHFGDLLENTHRLDPELVQRLVVRHSSGLDVLSAPDNREVDHPVFPEAVKQAFEFLRTRYEFVLVDCPPGLGPENMPVIKESDRVYLVATPELPALRRAARCLDELCRRGYDGDRIRVVINRDSTTRGRPEADRAEELLGARIDWRIPNQYQAVMRTLNLGAPFRSSAEVARSLSRWAAALTEERPARPRRAVDTGRDNALSLRTAECR